MDSWRFLSGTGGGTVNYSSSPESTVTGSSLLIKKVFTPSHVGRHLHVHQCGAWSHSPTHHPLVGTLFVCNYIHHLVQAAVSIVRNSQVVCYSGAANVIETSVGTYTHVAVSIIGQNSVIGSVH